MAVSAKIHHAFDCTGSEHQGCVEWALEAAEQICRRDGLRLTELRREVLRLVWSNHRPVGAYEILESLQKQGRAAPPTVYRTLDFLQESGLVHRLASLNAFVGCSCPGAPHAGQFLICERCRNLAELNDDRVTEAIARSASVAGFEARGQTVEITGICPACREEAAAHG